MSFSGDAGGDRFGSGGGPSEDHRRHRLSFPTFNDLLTELPSGPVVCRTSLTTSSSSPSTSPSTLPISGNMIPNGAVAEVVEPAVSLPDIVDLYGAASGGRPPDAGANRDDVRANLEQQVPCESDKSVPVRSTEATDQPRETEPVQNQSIPSSSCAISAPPDRSSTSVQSDSIIGDHVTPLDKGDGNHQRSDTTATTLRGEDTANPRPQEKLSPAEMNRLKINMVSEYFRKQKEELVKIEESRKLALEDKRQREEEEQRKKLKSVRIVKKRITTTTMTNPVSDPETLHGESSSHSDFKAGRNHRPGAALAPNPFPGPSYDASTNRGAVAHQMTTVTTPAPTTAGSTLQQDSSSSSAAFCPSYSASPNPPYGASPTQGSQPQSRPYLNVPMRNDGVVNPAAPQQLHLGSGPGSVLVSSIDHLNRPMIAPPINTPHPLDGAYTRRTSPDVVPHDSNLAGRPTGTPFRHPTLAVSGSTPIITSQPPPNARQLLHVLDDRKAVDQQQFLVKNNGSIPTGLTDAGQPQKTLPTNANGTTCNGVVKSFTQHWVMVANHLRVLMLDFGGSFTLFIPNSNGAVFKSCNTEVEVLVKPVANGKQMTYMKFSFENPMVEMVAPVLDNKAYGYQILKENQPCVFLGRVIQGAAPGGGAGSSLLMPGTQNVVAGHQLNSQQQQQQYYQQQPFYHQTISQQRLSPQQQQQLIQQQQEQQQQQQQQQLQQQISSPQLHRQQLQMLQQQQHQQQSLQKLEIQRVVVTQPQVSFHQPQQVQSQLGQSFPQETSSPVTPYQQSLICRRQNEELIPGNGDLRATYSSQVPLMQVYQSHSQTAPQQQEQLQMQQQQPQPQRQLQPQHPLQQHQLQPQHHLQQQHKLQEQHQLQEHRQIQLQQSQVGGVYSYSTTIQPSPLVNQFAPPTRSGQEIVVGPGSSVVNAQVVFSHDNSIQSEGIEASTTTLPLSIDNVQQQKKQNGQVNIQVNSMESAHLRPNSVAPNSAINIPVTTVTTLGNPSSTAAVNAHSSADNVPSMAITSLQGTPSHGTVQSMNCVATLKHPLEVSIKETTPSSQAIPALHLLPSSSKLSNDCTLSKKAAKDFDASSRTNRKVLLLEGSRTGDEQLLFPESIQQSPYPALKPDEEEKLLRCRFCSRRRFTFLSEHLVHMKSHTKDVDSIVEMSIKVWVPDRKLKCNLCKKFKSSYTLDYARHRDCHVVDGLACKVCTVRIETPAEYAEHLEIHHPSLIFASDPLSSTLPFMTAESLPVPVTKTGEAEGVDSYVPIVQDDGKVVSEDQNTGITASENESPQISEKQCMGQPQQEEDADEQMNSFDGDIGAVIESLLFSDDITDMVGQDRVEVCQDDEGHPQSKAESQNTNSMPILLDVTLRDETGLKGLELSPKSTNDNNQGFDNQECLVVDNDKGYSSSLGLPATISVQKTSIASHSSLVSEAINIAPVSKTDEDQNQSKAVFEEHQPSLGFEKDDQEFEQSAEEDDHPSASSSVCGNSPMRREGDLVNNINVTISNGDRCQTLEKSPVRNSDNAVDLNKTDDEVEVISSGAALPSSVTSPFISALTLPTNGSKNFSDSIGVNDGSSRERLTLSPHKTSPQLDDSIERQKPERLKLPEKTERCLADGSCHSDKSGWDQIEQESAVLDSDSMFEKTYDEEDDDVDSDAGSAEDYECQVCHDKFVTMTSLKIHKTRCQQHQQLVQDINDWSSKAKVEKALLDDGQGLKGFSGPDSWLSDDDNSADQSAVLETVERKMSNNGPRTFNWSPSRSSSSSLSRSSSPEAQNALNSGGGYYKVEMQKHREAESLKTVNKPLEEQHNACLNCGNKFMSLKSLRMHQMICHKSKVSKAKEMSVAAAATTAVAAAATALQSSSEDEDEDEGIFRIKSRIAKERRQHWVNERSKVASEECHVKSHLSKTLEKGPEQREQKLIGNYDCGSSNFVKASSHELSFSSSSSSSYSSDASFSSPKNIGHEEDKRESNQLLRVSNRSDEMPPLLKISTQVPKAPPSARLDHRIKGCSVVALKVKTPLPKDQGVCLDPLTPVRPQSYLSKDSPVKVTLSLGHGNGLESWTRRKDAAVPSADSCKALETFDQRQTETLKTSMQPLPHQDAIKSEMAAEPEKPKLKLRIKFGGSERQNGGRSSSIVVKSPTPASAPTPAIESSRAPVVLVTPVANEIKPEDASIKSVECLGKTGALPKLIIKLPTQSSRPSPTSTSLMKKNHDHVSSPLDPAGLSKSLVPAITSIPIAGLLSKSNSADRSTEPPDYEEVYVYGCEPASLRQRKSYLNQCVNKLGNGAAPGFLMHLDCLSCSVRLSRINIARGYLVEEIKKEAISKSDLKITRVRMKKADIEMVNNRLDEGSHPTRKELFPKRLMKMIGPKSAMLQRTTLVNSAASSSHPILSRVVTVKDVSKEKDKVVPPLKIKLRQNTSNAECLPLDGDKFGRSLKEVLDSFAGDEDAGGQETLPTVDELRKRSSAWKLSIDPVRDPTFSRNVASLVLDGLISELPLTDLSTSGRSSSTCMVVNQGNCSVHTETAIGVVNHAPPHSTTVRKRTSTTAGLTKRDYVKKRRRRCRPRPPCLWSDEAGSGSPEEPPPQKVDKIIIKNISKLASSCIAFAGSSDSGRSTSSGSYYSSSSSPEGASKTFNAMRKVPPLVIKAQLTGLFRGYSPIPAEKDPPTPQPPHQPPPQPPPLKLNFKQLFMKSKLKKIQAAKVAEKGRRLNARLQQEKAKDSDKRLKKVVVKESPQKAPPSKPESPSLAANVGQQENGAIKPFRTAVLPAPLVVARKSKPQPQPEDFKEESNQEKSKAASGASILLSQNSAPVPAASCPIGSAANLSKREVWIVGGHGQGIQNYSASMDIPLVSASPAFVVAKKSRPPDLFPPLPPPTDDPPFLPNLISSSQLPILSSCSTAAAHCQSSAFAQLKVKLGCNEAKDEARAEAEFLVASILEELLEKVGLETGKNPHKVATDLDLNAGSAAEPSSVEQGSDGCATPILEDKPVTTDNVMDEFKLVKAKEAGKASQLVVNSILDKVIGNAVELAEVSRARDQGKLDAEAVVGQIFDRLISTVVERTRKVKDAKRSGSIITYDQKTLCRGDSSRSGASTVKNGSLNRLKRKCPPSPFSSQGYVRRKRSRKSELRSSSSPTGRIKVKPFGPEGQSSFRADVGKSGFNESETVGGCQVYSLLQAQDSCGSSAASVRDEDVPENAPMMEKSFAAESTRNLEGDPLLQAAPANDGAPVPRHVFFVSDEFEPDLQEGPQLSESLVKMTPRSDINPVPPSKFVIDCSVPRPDLDYRAQRESPVGMPCIVDRSEQGPVSGHSSSATTMALSKRRRLKRRQRQRAASLSSSSTSTSSCSGIEGPHHHDHHHKAAPTKTELSTAGILALFPSESV